MDIGELQKSFSSCKNKLKQIFKILNITQLKKELDQLKFQSGQSQFWQLPLEEQTKKLKQKTEIEKSLQEYDNLIRLEQEIKSGLDLLGESKNDDIQIEVNNILANYHNLIEELEIKTILNDSQDDSTALLSINPGAGGVESQDWASMLFRMYKQWAKNREFNIKIIDLSSADEAGIKSVLIEISGYKAYGWLKYESGVHRLVRISPFDSAKRRHTSFASVSVTAEIGTNVNIEILDKDLKIDTFRSSGAGGQHVNTTDSAVRILHIPSKIVVKSQAERSQYKNKQTAIKILKSQLYKLEIENQRKQTKSAHNEKLDIDFGSQIRSYILYPYQLVKDHRSGFESADTTGVLNGKLDPILRSSTLFFKNYSKINLEVN